MKKVIWFCVGVFMATLASSCSETRVVRTITTGSHLQLTDDELVKTKNRPRSRYVVWGDHQGAVNSAIEVFQANGTSVVERARLREIIDELKVSLIHGADETNLLKVGRIAGADSILFVETTERSDSVTPSPGTLYRVFSGMAAANPQYVPPPPPASVMVHRPRVSVRAVSVETGEIKWSGSSTLTEGVTDPEIAYPILTQAAMHRAACLVEKGATWVEAASDGSVKQWGCISK
ncbi:MAG: hypothetical protein NDI90_11165 [Nitrospira sp. BO4]|nr:hypothetical protein [Nitrospira sp. BO4]